MIYRNLGRYGLSLSVLGLDFRAEALSGLGRGAVRELLAAVVDSGINYFHTRTSAADAGAQQLLGELISDLHLPRDRYCLGTQVGAATADPCGPTQRGLSRKALREACDQTLQRFGTDYLDLVICEAADAATPPDETAAAMQLLVQQGKVLYWGVQGDAGQLAAMGASDTAAVLQCLPLPWSTDAQAQAQHSAASYGQIATLEPAIAAPAALARLIGQPGMTSVVVPVRSRSELAGWLGVLD